MQALDRPLAGLVTSRVVDVAGTSTLRAAALLLDDEAVGALLIEETRGTLGIFTERDLVRAIADGADVDQGRVADYLTDDLLIVDGTASYAQALEAMRTNEIRHVVVRINDRVGVVSMRALVDALLPSTCTPDKVTVSSS